MGGTHQLRHKFVVYYAKSPKEEVKRWTCDG